LSNFHFWRGIKLSLFYCSGRKLSPNPPKRAAVVEKDEGISDEEDTAELKLQLELNEQVSLKEF
jgi:hypothetical protein